MIQTSWKGKPLLLLFCLKIKSRHTCLMYTIELTVLSLLAFKFSTQLDQIKIQFPMHADAIIKRTKAFQGVQFVIKE